MRIGIMGEVSGDVVIVDVELIARKQHQRAEVRRPPDSVILEIVDKCGGLPCSRRRR